MTTKTSKVREEVEAIIDRLASAPSQYPPNSEDAYYEEMANYYEVEFWKNTILPWAVDMAEYDPEGFDDLMKVHGNLYYDAWLEFMGV